MKYMDNNMYLCTKDSEIYLKSESAFMLPIVFQCRDCFEQSEEGLIVKNVLIPEGKMTFLPYDYYCFPNKVNIIKPGSIFLEYSNDGQLLTLRDFDTRCVKKKNLIRRTTD